MTDPAPMPQPTVPLIRLVVFGEPWTQGSKTAVVDQVSGKARVLEQKGNGRTRHRLWRRAVAAAALEYRWTHRSLPLPLDEPVHVTVDFALPRPISPTRTRAANGDPKYTIPAWRRWPWTGLDIDKLQRSTYDSLVVDETQQPLLLATDARIISNSNTERFTEPGERPHAAIIILPLGHLERGAGPRTCPRCCPGGLGGVCAHAPANDGGVA